MGDPKIFFIIPISIKDENNNIYRHISGTYMALKTYTFQIKQVLQ